MEDHKKNLKGQFKCQPERYVSMANRTICENYIKKLASFERGRFAALNIDVYIMHKDK